MTLRTNFTDGVDSVDAAVMNQIGTEVNAATSAAAAAAETAEWIGVSGKPTEFPPSTHTHGLADVEGLGDAIGPVIAGGTAGQVWTSKGGSGEWKAPATPAGAPGVRVSGGSGGLTEPTGSGVQQVVIGHSATAGADSNNTVVGAFAKGNPMNGGTAVGAFADISSGATGSGKVALGNGASSLHSESVAIGANSVTTKPNQIILGKATQIVTCPNRIEIGSGAAMVTLYTEIVGGKSVLKAQHATGAAVTISTEP